MVGGGASDPLAYAGQVVYTGERAVETDVLTLDVEMTWLGGADDAEDMEITVSISVLANLEFAYPDGIPETILPDTATTIDVIVTGKGKGVPVENTGDLHYSIDGGAYVVADMTETLPNEYTASLPIIGCNQSIDFYFSAEEILEGTLYDHDTSPFGVFSANEIDTLFYDDFEADAGWTISGGQWARGVPTGGGGEYGYPDPTRGTHGNSVLGYNLNGDYPINMPQYHATSPAFDCTDMENVQLRFQRYLGVEEPAYDHAYIRISTNGTTWSTVWENPRTVEDSSWNLHTYDISQWADGEATVYLRFTQGVSDGGWNWCGWNIDGLAVVARNCRGPQYLCGDINNDGVGPNIEDLIYLVVFMFQDGPPPPFMESTDVDGNDVGPDIADLIFLVNFMFNEGPDLICDGPLATPATPTSKSAIPTN